MQHRGVRRAERLALAVLALALAGSCIAACIADEGYRIWALNDSDHTIVLVIRERGQHTYAVPPHSYAGVLGGMGHPEKDWTVSLVDEHCGPLQQWPVNSKLDLLYVDAAGKGDYLSGLAWGHGLRTAKQSAAGRRDPPCP